MMELDFHLVDERYAGLRVRDPSYEKRLLASLAEQGQRLPVLVVADVQAAGKFVLIDGHKRLRCLRRLHRDTIAATSLDMSESDALLFTRVLGRAHRECALEQGWLLEVLRERFGWSLEEAAARFDKSESWISRRLALVRELPGDIQESVRRGAICPHAAMKYLVPLARANPGDCARLAEIAVEHKLSSRQVGELYSGWRNARVAVRDRILDDPLLFLRSQEEARAAREDLDTRRITDVLRDAGILAATARRLQRWLDAAGTLASIAEADVEQVSHATALAIRTLQQLQAACDPGEEHRSAG